ncbi:MAG TPA: radical SAM protein, partial [Erysipelothrix sp.]
MNTEALYVHIPFCDHICGYCAFNRFLYNRKLSDDFMNRLLSQIENLPNTYKTIYVGGGTPTSLHTDQLEPLLLALKAKLQAEYEWTFEANPENLTEDKVLLL